MADFGLQVVQSFSPAEIAAQAMRGDGLAGRADVVALAFDRHQRGLLDRAGLDRLATHPEAAVRQIMVAETRA